MIAFAGNLWQVGYVDNLHVSSHAPDDIPNLIGHLPDTPLSISSKIMVGKSLFLTSDFKLSISLESSPPEGLSTVPALGFAYWPKTER